MQRVGIVVQARMSSSRLPGKVLMPVLGRPLLWYLLQSLRQVSAIDHLVVATSSESSDTPIEKFCREFGVNCFRGPLNDVADRFLKVIEEYPMDAFVRICGDCPLLDYRLVDRAVALFRKGDFDVVTCAVDRTFPQGQVVEVVSVEAFRKQLKFFRNDADREHVTRRIYLEKDRFHILNFTAPRNLWHCRMAVDTRNDFKRVEAMLSVMSRPHYEYGYEELAEIAGEVDA